MVLHPPVEEEWEWRVADLIDWRFKSWDCEVIESKFHMEDAEAIMRIPLSRRRAEDVMIWLLTKDGEYSVRSGYHVARMISKQNNSLGESSRTAQGNSVWKSLWKTNIPNKIKAFGWRASQNALPTKENLSRRGIIDNDRCELCEQASESVIHVLWECGMAQDIWAGSMRRLQKGITNQMEFSQLVEELMLRLSEEEWEIFWVQCWLAWNQRNLIMHGGKIQDPTRLNQRAQEYCEEYREAQCRLAIPTSTDSVHKWCPPSGSAFKLNFDAAIFSNTSSSGFWCYYHERDG